MKWIIIAVLFLGGMGILAWYPDDAVRVIPPRNQNAVRNRTADGIDSTNAAYSDARNEARRQYDAGLLTLPEYQGRLQAIDMKRVEETRIEKNPMSGGCRKDTIRTGNILTLDIGAGCLGNLPLLVWRGENKVKATVEILTPQGYGFNADPQFTKNRTTDIATSLGGNRWEFQGEIFYLHQMEGVHYLVKITFQ